jgi:hypothetical protein
MQPAELKFGDQFSKLWLVKVCNRLLTHFDTLNMNFFSDSPKRTQATLYRILTWRSAWVHETALVSDWQPSKLK